MKAFVVRVNGKHLCTAGVGPDGVLAAIVSWVGHDERSGRFAFHLGGIDGRTGEHVEIGRHGSEWGTS